MKRYFLLVVLLILSISDALQAKCSPYEDEQLMEKLKSDNRQLKKVITNLHNKMSNGDTEGVRADLEKVNTALESEKARVEELITVAELDKRTFINIANDRIKKLSLSGEDRSQLQRLQKGVTQSYDTLISELRETGHGCRSNLAKALVNFEKILKSFEEPQAKTTPEKSIIPSSFDPIMDHPGLM